jgi:triosephosphate isomerase
LDEAIHLVNDIEDNLSSGLHSKVEIIIFPAFTHLISISSKIKQLNLGAQNFYPAENGAFTGEISVKQVIDAKAKYVLIGHSERRELFFESNAIVQQKVICALNNNITPVFCCGEPLEARLNGYHFDFVEKQLHESLKELGPSEMNRIIIAYEPIWAIGTGKTATNKEAEEMHAFIRSWIRNQHGNECAESISILYGGSCNPTNANELFACPNIDGGLIGGASLNPQQFLSIVNILNGLS